MRITKCDKQIKCDKLIVNHTSSQTVYSADKQSCSAEFVISISIMMGCILMTSSVQGTTHSKLW